MNRKTWLASLFVLGAVVLVGIGLAGWKIASLQAAFAATANQPEPMESVVAAPAMQRSYRPTKTSIGTVLALRSVTLRNELAGTVRKVALTPGKIVEAGTVLVALDVAVEEAELQAQQAQAALAETALARMERLIESNAVSKEQLDRARAEHQVAVAQIARTRAVIERKTIRAPFRARVGIADVHPGQYLNEGTELTTLQGVDEAAHVDFAVEQQVAGALRAGESVEILTATDNHPIPARIVAIDARVDPATRNSTVRARIEDATRAPAPGASVRVRFPVGAQRAAVVVPANALRKGPGGDAVFVLITDEAGQARAQERAVKAGALLGDEVVIVGGLAPGEQVATSGSFKLRDAALVALVDAQQSGAQPQAQPIQ